MGSFLKIISVVASGGTVTNFSPRFSMSGMTGSFPDNVIAGLKSVTGTTGPASQVDTTGDKIDAASFGVPYSMQTGPIIYAPMQTYPGTKITKSKPTPLYPTSAYTIATTFLPANVAIQSTATQAITWAFSQQENPVGVIISFPSDETKPFLGVSRSHAK
jgi:hypothetical protein